jgi:hypothetical protein
MASAEQFLADLSTKRQKWVEANRENNFDKGILNLLTRLYPDQAHFIFELLQNAEDAGATAVKFDLCKQMLRFEHDGSREFTQEDVDSITSIGNSSKLEDTTRIGEFGVGFKSVFAYTSTPRILSGQFAFEIKDLVCPHPLVDRVASSNQTCFEFPFNSESRTPGMAFREVCEGLENLDSRTLLFLKEIHRISWKIEGGGEGSLERSQFDGGDDRLVEIRRKVDSAPPENSLWLRFWRDSSVKPDLGVSIAYSLERLDKRRRIDSNVRLADQCQIVPVDGGLSIWFPAAKETTKLRFQVHGPFAATVARDTIVAGDEDNQALLADCAQLVASSLEELKDLELLTARFLAVLPNTTDELTDFYQPILDEVLKAVRSRPLLPIEGGGHAPASELVSGPPRIKSVIDQDVLRLMTSAEDPDVPTRMWAAGGGGARARAFLHSADVSEWSWGELMGHGMEVFTGPRSTRPEVQEWIANRSDDWLQKFYALLWDGSEQTEFDVSADEWEILRLSDGSHVARHYWEPSVYFPSTEAVASEVRTLSPDVLPSEDSALANKVRNFLALAGVEEIGERERVSSLLRAFYSGEGPGPSLEEHCEHLRSFVAWWRETKDESCFTGHPLFYGWDEVALVEPESLCLDLPFKATGLGHLYSTLDPDDPQRVRLSKIYHGVGIDDLVPFAKALGMVDSLVIEETDIYGLGKGGGNFQRHPGWVRLYYISGGRRSHLGCDMDWHIEGLDELLKLDDAAVSETIWRTMQAAPSDALKAKYRRNKGSRIETADSSLVIKLQKAAWVPAKDGKFYSPLELTPERLPTGFPVDDRNGWLTAIGFGRDAEEESAEQEGRAESLASAAATLGLSVSEAEDITEALETLPEEERRPFIKNFVDRARRHGEAKFPERESPDPNRRKQKVEQRASEALSREYSVRGRSVRVSGHREREDGKVYLRDHYTNEHGVMVCQVCQEAMPFKLKDGSYYFETVEALPLNREHTVNLLALCPVCAAKYLYANEMDKPQIREEIIECDGPCLCVELAGSEEELRFVQQHYDDLKAVLLSEVEEGE